MLHPSVVCCRGGLCLGKPVVRQRRRPCATMLTAGGRVNVSRRRRAAAGGATASGRDVPARRRGRRSGGASAADAGGRRTAAPPASGGPWVEYGTGEVPREEESER